MNKNLVYFTVFNFTEYMDLLQILMISIKLFSKTDGIDFLVLTQPDFIPKLENIANIVKIPILYKLYNTNNLFDTCLSRLLVFEYTKINQYEKILYLDVDIIVQGNLTGIFNEEIEDKIHAVREGIIEHEYHGGQFFDFEKIDKNLPGFNSGVLLFKNTEIIRQLFQDTLTHMKSYVKVHGIDHKCMEQAFVNYQFIKNSRYNVELMDKYGLIYCIEPPPPPSTPTSVVLCHFVWPLGNASHKKERMVKHFRHIVENYEKMIFLEKSVSSHRLEIFSSKQLTLDDEILSRTVYA